MILCLIFCRGGTKTIAVLMDSSGTIIAECTGASSNPWVNESIESSAELLNKIDFN